MPHIFISYAKADTQALAFALCDHFNDSLGMTAWVDRNLTAGRNWESQIQKEIRKCDVFIILYSPDINRHLYDETKTESYVLEEIAYARYTLNKTIIPVMAQVTEPPLGMTRMQYINFAAGGMSLLQLSQKILQEAGIAATLAPTPTKPLLAGLLDQFTWIDIPAGDLTVKINDEKTQTYHLKPYRISQNLVTNAQYAKFIEAGGYNEPRWWTEIGWRYKEEGHKWRMYKSQRRYLRSSTPWKVPLKSIFEKYNGPDQPVAGVSWYEAVAFYLWLSEITEAKILLPTEPQWQRAKEQNRNFRNSTPKHMEWCLTSAYSQSDDIHEDASRRIMRHLAKPIATIENAIYRSNESKRSENRGVFTFRIAHNTEG